MKVAFGTTLLSQCMRTTGIDGIGTYTRELMAHMPSQVELKPFSFGDESQFDRAGFKPFPAGSFSKQAILSFLGGGFFEFQNRIERNDCCGIDLIHATDHLIPRVRNLPVVATIFDAIPLSNPEWVAYRYKKIKNELWKKTASWASHIITISEFSRQQIAEFFGISLDRITAIPLGVGAQWFSPVDEIIWEKIKRQYSLPDNYLVNVGTIQPRKNIGRLLAAHAALPSYVQREFPLVILGKNGWGCEVEVDLMRDGKMPNVKWLGHVSDEVVQVIVKKAHAMIFPSLMEGFGLPVLEAFAAGVPVVASSASAIPEVAGDAVIYMNPYFVDDIASAILLIIGSAEKRKSLSAKGREQVIGFNWSECAQLTLRIYEDVVGKKNSL